MNPFLKHICASFLILMSGMMSAQNTGCITLDVDFSVELSESADMTGNAVVSFQGKAFIMSGNGVEAYCDGTTIWTLDLEAKEVYIESVTPETESYMKDLKPRLTALEKGSSASFLSPEGQKVNIRVNSVKKTAGKDISSFRPVRDFDSSWVITDLR